MTSQIWIALAAYFSSDRPGGPRPGEESFSNSTDSQYYRFSVLLMLEKVPISSLFEVLESRSNLFGNSNQLILFDF